MNCIGLLGGQSGLALVSEMHKRGIKVALVVGKPGESGSDAADYVLVSDFSNHDEIVRFFKKNGVHGVILGTGPFVIIGLAKRLLQEEIMINVDLDKLELCKDKYILKNLIAEHKIDTPQYILFNNMNELEEKISKFNYPCVIKSIKDYFEPRKVNNEESFRAAAKQFFEAGDIVMYEEYIFGNDFTVFVCNYGDRYYYKPIFWSKGHDYIPENGFEDSYTEPLKSEEEKELEKFVKKVVEATDIPGVFRIDLIYLNGVFYFLEINTILVSSIASDSYDICFYQNHVNRAQYIVDYALTHFGYANTIRKENRVVFFEKEYEQLKHRLKQTEDINYIYIDSNNIVLPFNNDRGLYPYGIKLFCEYLDENNICYDKELAQRIMMCIITCDVDKVFYIGTKTESKEYCIIKACADYIAKEFELLQ